MKLGSAIQNCRQIRGMSKAELARQIGKSRSYINHLENDDRQPGLTVLKELASKLQIPLSVLILIGSEKISLEGFSEEDLNSLASTLEELIRSAFPLQSELEF